MLYFIGQEQPANRSLCSAFKSCSIVRMRSMQRECRYVIMRVSSGVYPFTFTCSGVHPFTFTCSGVHPFTYTCSGVHPFIFTCSGVHPFIFNLMDSLHLLHLPTLTHEWVQINGYICVSSTGSSGTAASIIVISDCFFC